MSIENTSNNANVNFFNSSSNFPNQSINSTSITYTDDLIKEYLFFRGFNQSLKSLEHDIKQDKDRCFKADKITDQLLSFIYSYDLNGLLEYWSYLDYKYFSRLTHKLSNLTNVSITRKYELFLLRFYLIHSIQTSKPEKAFEFFESYAAKLQSQNEWKDWYCLPFLKNPEDNPLFSIYFGKNWIETIIISLQNFLNIVFQSLQNPRLLNYEEDYFWNRQYMSKMNNSSTNSSSNMVSLKLEQDYHDLVDEFHYSQNQTQYRQSNTLISMIKNLTNSKSKSNSNIKSNNVSAQQNDINNLTLPVSKPSWGISSPSTENSSNTSAPDNRKLNKTSINLDLSRETQQESSFLNKEPKQNNLKSFKSLGSNSFKSVIEDTTQNLSVNQNSINSSLIDQNINRISEIQLDESSNYNELKLTNKITQDDSKSNSDPFLILNQEDYFEHKSTILDCKFSKDEKYIASVDVDGIVKIWSIDNQINTTNTIMQRSIITSIEWDKKSNKILYLGTKGAVVKVYDILLKRIIQEISFNKLYPIINNISSSPLNGKLVITMKQNSTQNKIEQAKTINQMVICQPILANNNLTLEKVFELDAFYSQSSIFYPINYFVLGCSDGFLRLFDMETNQFIKNFKCHANNIINLLINKEKTQLVSLSNDNVTKIWSIDSTLLELNCLATFIYPLNLNERNFSNFNSNSQLNKQNQSANFQDFEFSFGTFILYDSSEKFLLILDKNGVLLNEICLTDAIKYENANKLLDSENKLKTIHLNEISLFNMSNPTTIQLRNANHSSILIVGSSNGAIRIFKLLHRI